MFPYLKNIISDDRERKDDSDKIYLFARYFCTPKNLQLLSRFIIRVYKNRVVLGICCLK